MTLSRHPARAARRPLGRTRCRNGLSPATSRYTPGATAWTSVALEGAPASVATAVICFPPSEWFARLSRDERPGWEVSPLSRGVMLPSRLAHGLSLKAQPLSCPLQASLRFFRHPLPTGPSASLAARFPSCLRETFGLTTFRASTCVG